eukprot:1978630-Rhodomonas_salina.3
MPKQTRIGGHVRAGNRAIKWLALIELGCAKDRNRSSWLVQTLTARSSRARFTTATESGPCRRVLSTDCQRREGRWADVRSSSERTQRKMDKGRYLVHKIADEDDFIRRWIVPAFLNTWRSLLGMQQSHYNG